MRSTYSIKLELLFDFKVKVKQVNLFELKLNLSITLLKTLLELLAKQLFKY